MNDLIECPDCGNTEPYRCNRIVPTAYYRICNRISNHRGLAAINLLLNNYLSMYRYYKRIGEFPAVSSKRKYQWNILKACIIGWTPHELTIRRYLNWNEPKLVAVESPRKHMRVSELWFDKDGNRLT